MFAEEYCWRRWTLEHKIDHIAQCLTFLHLSFTVREVDFPVDNTLWQSVEINLIISTMITISISIILYSNLIMLIILNIMLVASSRIPTKPAFPFSSLSPLSSSSSSSSSTSPASSSCSTSGPRGSQPPSQPPPQHLRLLLRHRHRLRLASHILHLALMDFFTTSVFVILISWHILVSTEIHLCPKSLSTKYCCTLLAENPSPLKSSFLQGYSSHFPRVF